MLGEDDSIWDPYREEASAERSRTLAAKRFHFEMVTAVRKMDANQMNEQINK
ncbi:spore coat protein YlbD [Bacillus licheniformis]|nr:spore coat protein YlbD [Bacillus licheniformis]